MKGFDCRSYVQVVILFFSGTTVKGTIASSLQTNEVTPFSHERIEHKEDNIYWSELPMIGKDEVDASTISVSTKSSALSSSATSSWSKLRNSLFAKNDVDIGYEAQLKRQRLCDIGDGYIYREDEVLGTFETRCGSIEQFPCYCAPDLDPPISCPYCGFHSEISNGKEERLQQSKSVNLFCLQDGEKSDPFVASEKDKTVQQCYCNLEGDIPVSTCHSASSSDKDLSRSPDAIEGTENKTIPYETLEENETTDIEATTNSNESSKQDICTLELDSGEIKTFQRGESYGDFLPNECQQPSRFPCRCNPDLYDQIECPYCSFRTDNGDLVCAEHDQTVSFFVPGSESRDVETCTCWVPEDPSQKPFKACTVTSYSLDSLEKDADHYYAMSKESGNENADNNNSKPSTKGCDITDSASGESSIVPIGESFADYLEVEGTCGNGVDWPAYCTGDATAATDTAIVHLSGKHDLDQSARNAGYINDRKDIAYPYCIFRDTLSGTPVCAKDTGDVVYTNSDEEKIRCSCRYSNSNGGQTETACSPYLPPPDDSIPMKRNRSSGAAVPRSITYPTDSPVEESDAGVSIVNGILRRTLMFVVLGHAFTMVL